jgi:hypothetical protein
MMRLSSFTLCLDGHHLHSQDPVQALTPSHTALVAQESDHGTLLRILSVFRVPKDFILHSYVGGLSRRVHMYLFANQWMGGLFKRENTYPKPISKVPHFQGPKIPFKYLRRSRSHHRQSYSFPRSGYLLIQLHSLRPYHYPCPSSFVLRPDC